MNLQTPTVLEIDRKLREDFRRRVRDYGVSTDTTDPLLAVLFRTVAQQIDEVYSDTAQLRVSLLHELMQGLHMEQYLARPAQAVVRLVQDRDEPRTLRAGTELNAVASSGERLIFSLDAAVDVSRARIALALSYQDQSLRILSGVEMSEDVQAARPSLDTVPIQLGPQPALYLAVENLSPQLLSRHGLFFELGPGTYAVQHALAHEPWWIFGSDGELSSSGLMRPERINAGLMQLRFYGDLARTENHAASARPSIPDGFYAGRQFVFPSMSAEQNLLCRVPRLLEPAMARLVNRDVSQIFHEPRFWIKIPMPPGVPALHHAISGIVLHAMTASNVFVRNQTVHFAQDGTSFPISKAGGVPEHLVAPLTVMSIENEPYDRGTRPRTRSTAGWYELSNGRLTLTPGARENGMRDTAANIRLWLTNGHLGNSVGPGDITGFASAALAGLHVAPLTAASGGTDGDTLPTEERRFANALLTRGRIVTRADLETAALAIDRRILAAAASSGVERREGGLRRVERLSLTLDPHGFSRPEVELPALKSQVEVTLRGRLVQGVDLEVQFLWN
ncbi:hypothetical protein [Silvibacterium dinghuense]|uniref:Baseplate protein J-like domain-containing protein n=1 Tax=Silvibacterium dinghuense TaxID=1560006 RepID=A0A4Q1SIJ7_9BACT|nr:hypothetical protein [Silvibacterium dinghuense]RXS97438.1 hypothetical protein ESZ00_05950 [Silvibacterium dinghuense]GGG99015.1 hypothetical protein GCM10011586_13130 [Silvibacterium dinghuense]